MKTNKLFVNEQPPDSEPCPSSVLLGELALESTPRKRGRDDATDEQTGSPKRRRLETPTPKKQQAGARSSTTKRDHPYSERTTPRTRMKSLKGILTKAKRKLYTTKQSLERKKKKIVNLVSVLAQLKEQHLLSNETEEELESFGELPEDLIKGWRSNVQMPASRRRYSDKMRKFATTLYYHSPKAYAYLSSTFPMPSKVTLRTWLKVVDGWPGFTQGALATSSERTRFRVKEKSCVQLC